MVEYRLDLGREHQGIRAPDIEQRRDAGRVARQQHHAAVRIVECQGELAFEPVEEGEPKFFIEVHQHLDVDIGPEAVSAALQLGAQCTVVEDLPIADENDRAVFVEDWLGAAGRVDNGETPHAECETGLAMTRGVVGAAMRQCFGHARQQVPIRQRWIPRCIEADKTAHA